MHGSRSRAKDGGGGDGTAVLADDTGGAEWWVYPLEADERAVRVDVRPLRTHRNGLRKRGLDNRVTLFSRRIPGADGDETRWSVLVGERARVRVNGYPVVTGYRLLEHRDEIDVPGVGIVWFSTEELARVERFPGSARPTYCARMKVEITRGSPAVRCPSCRTWFAQSEQFPGWTYGSTCVMCRHPTDLDAGLRWMPGGA